MKYYECEHCPCRFAADKKKRFEDHLKKSHDVTSIDLSMYYREVRYGRNPCDRYKVCSEWV